MNQNIKGWKRQAKDLYTKIYEALIKETLISFINGDTN